MRKLLLVVLPAVATATVVVWTWRVAGGASVWFAFVVVWAPMAGLGTASRAVRLRLPGRLHELRAWERDGRVYERLGVRVAKSVLRRGPLAAFNPHLHLPAERTPAQLAALDERMCEAEASHAVLLVVVLVVVVHAVARGWWVAAVWTLVFDVLMNGYPVMLQRYNRALLAGRFATA
ncbi:MAG: hypothetical protein F2534_13685 [Actinobacteria bacterium]|uniref:Unannotated protein n=1 Tax=freshwater metagenome TaxID=449393 RepID=A0A6J6EL19_9ZZZZ|nr:hypothetical protein [Actinomycetota bacterium]